MKVAVWDTYVKVPSGEVLHFDILVPDQLRDAAVIYQYGKAYLQSRGAEDGVIDSDHCQFCHIEQPDEEMLQSIEQRGYYILELDTIPAQLPAEPTRRDLVLHLRAHYSQYRFADFRGVGQEALMQMVERVQ
jgi:hypothetical protein